MARRCEITNKDSRSGNLVSHSNIKTKRVFGVNIQEISLTSDALNKTYQMRIALSTLRSIDHNGGLDNYLLKTSNTKLSDKAVTLKRRIKKALAAKKAA